MSEKHTPGPLIVRVGSNGDAGIIATSQRVQAPDNIGGALIAECYAEIRIAGEGARGEALANATLFAASHDMLAALQLFVAYQAAIDSDDPAARPLEAYSTAMDAAYAAIAKAGSPA